MVAFLDGGFVVLAALTGQVLGPQAGHRLARLNK